MWFHRRAMRHRRPPTIARRGMVVASHPLAAEAGAAMLRAGGHAVDAAIAAAAVLSVVEPSASGLGGDAFLLIFDAADGTVSAINGSGVLPEGVTTAADPGSFRRGPLSLTVPGGVSAWDEASYGWGRLEWDALLEPARRLAEEGFAVSCRMASILRRERATLAADPGLAALFLTAGGAPLTAGSVCRPASLARTLKSLAQEGAESFYQGSIARRLVRGVRNAGGALSAEDLERHEAELRAPIEHRLSLPLGLRAADGSPTAVAMIEQPLPSQGILLPLACSLLEAIGPADEWLELHHQIEAMKIVRAVGDLFLGDPRALPVSEEELVDALLAPETIRAWRALIGSSARDTVLRSRTEQRARLLALQRQKSGKKAGRKRRDGRGERDVPGEGPLRGGQLPTQPTPPASLRLRDLVWQSFAAAGAGQTAIVEAFARAGLADGIGIDAGSDTTYLCAVDHDGNAVGLIQSIFHPFGGGFLEPETGIILNNRAAGFSSDRHSANRREPGRRARHTLNSWMLLREGRPWVVGGTPGAMNQITVNLQVVRALLAGAPPWPGPAPMVDERWSQARMRERAPLDPTDRLAAILEAPRWDFDPHDRVRFEARLPADPRRRLRRVGHDPVRGGPWDGTGFVQAIEILPTGSLLGATDPRGEGAAVGL